MLSASPGTGCQTQRALRSKTGSLCLRLQIGGSRSRTWGAQGWRTDNNGAGDPMRQPWGSRGAGAGPALPAASHSPEPPAARSSERGWSGARAPCGHPSRPCQPRWAPRLFSGAPQAPQALLTHCILLRSITLPCLLLPKLPALPSAPRHSTIPPRHIPVIPNPDPSAVSSQPRASPGDAAEEGSRGGVLTADSRLYRSPEAMPHFSTLLQPARRPVPKKPSGACGEEEVSPELAVAPTEGPR